MTKEAQVYGRRLFGEHPLYFLPKQEDREVNRETLLWLYRSEGLTVRERGRRKWEMRVRTPFATPVEPYQKPSLGLTLGAVQDCGRFFAPDFG